MQKPWENLPNDFLERLHTFVPQDKVQSVLESFTVRKPSTFRANTLKITADQLEEKLKMLGIEIERVSWYKDAFILKNVPQKVLTDTDLYKNGFFYVQSLSSMIPPLVLHPQQDERVLDITAAPGSKTTQIASLMENAGEIIANDKSRIRMYKLEANLTIQGVTNTKTLYLPGEFLWKKYPEYFDRVLVDVPCSMEGRFYTDDPKTYQDYSRGKVKQLAEMQKWILRSAVSSTQPGGTVVYSTCTLSPEENEGVVDWILKKEGEHLEVEKIAIPNLSYSEGLTSFGNKHYDLHLKNAMRIYPSKTMEGFFVVKLKKLSSNLPDKLYT